MEQFDYTQQRQKVQIVRVNYSAQQIKKRITTGLVLIFSSGFYSLFTVGHWAWDINTKDQC